MADRITISNLALQAVGAKSTIADPEENLKEAKAIRVLWDQTRDELLGRIWWNMARKTEILSLLKRGPGAVGFTGIYAGVWSTAWPPQPWQYSYAYPVDCISARYIVPQGSMTAWTGTPLFSTAVGQPSMYAVNGAPIKFVQASDVDTTGKQIRVILCNQDQAALTYTTKVENTDLWDADFTSVFVAFLAAYLAQPLTGQRSLRTDLLTVAEAKLKEAATSDANEGLTIQQQPLPDWLRVRGVADDHYNDLPPYGSAA